MATVAEVLQAVGGESPGWFVASALVLALTWALSRRQTQTARQQAESARSQGRRIGRLEKVLALEVVRRRQLEAVLLADGLRLPWWPEDNTPPDREFADHDHDDHQVDDDGPNTSAVPSIPPLPEFPRHRR